MMIMLSPKRLEYLSVWLRNCQPEDDKP